MTDRERLSELIVDIENKILQSCPYTTDTFRIENIADHLLANGVIVPPCKVGDTVYQIDSERVYEYKVKNVIYDTPSIAFDRRAIGNGTLFLTREEAEKALSELNKGE